MTPGTTLTRTLILLRHAKSAWPADTPDRQRPLAARGLRDAPAVGRWLLAHIPAIDQVVYSPAARAVQTWDLAVDQLATAPPASSDERVYGASAACLLAVTQEFAPEVSTAVLVGHNPGLEDFLTLLTGATEPLKTSSLAVITLPGSWADAAPGAGRLENLATPRG
jgi:phosphohistidine phosphatase